MNFLWGGPARILAGLANFSRSRRPMLHLAVILPNLRLLLRFDHVTVGFLERSGGLGDPVIELRQLLLSPNRAVGLHRANGSEPFESALERLIVGLHTPSRALSDVLNDFEMSISLGGGSHKLFPGYSLRALGPAAVEDGLALGPNDVDPRLAGALLTENTVLLFEPGDRIHVVVVELFEGFVQPLDLVVRQPLQARHHSLHPGVDGVFGALIQPGHEPDVLLR